MPEHDFTTLFEHYPTIIALMPEVFTSHQFILRLAQQHQTLYIEALYSYRHSPHRGSPAPFRMVHQLLARRLHAYPDWVAYIGTVKSTDIFGQVQECAQWRKL
jgi:hypothetical protein